ncbi:MAG TPA: hypothetical protein PKD63_02230 [Solirubrobacteraceae bacterium]|nr:hypothetical protein [Solirubrobacteraceae bacterium]
MTGDGEQRDVRESLGDLERRLLDLERELRTDASEDATVAAGAPAPTTKGKGKRAERAAPAPEEGGGGVAAPPAPPPDIDLFAQDARAKVAALRDTLDGLSTATDRLRETAQTVVEDHGRALVRLERATGAPAAIVIPAATPAPPAAPVEPPKPPEPPEPPAEAPVAAEPGPAAPEPEPEPEPDASTPTLPPRPELPQLPPLPWRRILAALVAIAILGLGYALLFGGGGEPKAPPGPSGIAATDAAITAAGGGIGAIPDLRTGVEGDVRSDLCSGRTAAAIDVVTPGGAVWKCPGIRQVAAPVLVASGFARQTARGRTCVSVPSAPGLDQRRRDARLTARRDEAVRRAARKQAYAAGAAFDRRNGLTLLDGAPAPGEPCIAATPRNLRTGSYPLSTRLILYALADSAESAEVRQAAARLRSYFSGTPPLYAIVLTK